MVFDKQAYWHRRKFTRPVEVDDPKKPGKKMTIEVPAPMRGQEPLPRPVVAKWTEEDFKASKCTKDEIGKPREPKNMEYRMDPKVGLVPFPRREPIVASRKYTKKGVAHEVNAPHERIVLPITDPKLTNHARMIMRKKYREGNRQKAAASNGQS